MLAHRDLFFLSVVILALMSNAMNNNVPKTSNQQMKSQMKNAAIGLLGVSAPIGKYILDGPDFQEKVSLTGKVVAITGASSGLGLVNAITLAKLGAKVYMLNRDLSKSAQAIKEEGGESYGIDVIKCDLADLNSVKNAADELKSKTNRIDILINNAGVMAIPTRTLTKDNFESHIGINHLAHFYLTSLLFGVLVKSGKENGMSRIINVASAAHFFGNSNLQTDIFLSDKYEKWNAYGNSKLANILFTNKLAQDIKTSGLGEYVSAYSLHPGGCRTELGRYIVDPKDIPPYALPILAPLGLPLFYFTKSKEKGAQTQIYLSASTEMDKQKKFYNGEYFDNSKISSARSDLAKNSELADWLWKTSNKYTNSNFVV